jgi:hypothetical protein
MMFVDIADTTVPNLGVNPIADFVMKKKTMKGKIQQS